MKIDFTEPDLKDSNTLLSESWKNPLIPVSDRLQIVDEAVDFRNKVIDNLRKQIEELNNVSDKLYNSLQEVLQLRINDESLEYKMQFSMQGRAVGGKAFAARELYKSIKEHK